jgi:hypothetical protein
VCVCVCVSQVRGALPLAVPRDAERCAWRPPSTATGHAAAARGHAGRGGRPRAWDAVFALSNGVATSYGPAGQLNWQTHDLPGWSEGARGWVLRLPRARAAADPHVHGDPHRDDPLGMELLVNKTNNRTSKNNGCSAFCRRRGVAASRSYSSY